MTSPDTPRPGRPGSTWERACEAMREAAAKVAEQQWTGAIAAAAIRSLKAPPEPSDLDTNPRPETR